MNLEPGQMFILVKILEELNPETQTTLMDCIGKLLSANFKLMQESFQMLNQLNKKTPNDKVTLFLLGLHHQFGLGCTPNLKTAYEYYKNAAAKQFIPAQYKMALFQENGAVGLKENKKKALEAYEQLAKVGYAPAQNNLALALREGVVVKRDSTRAVQLFEEAAKQHLAHGLYNLGEHYQHTPSIPNHMSRAVVLYKEAAAQKHHLSLLRLGELHEQNNHFFPGLLIAYDYYNECAQLKNEEAIEKFNSLKDIHARYNILQKNLPQLPSILVGIILDYHGHTPPFTKEKATAHRIFA